jgi:glutathione synthase/RimK-type ligase-like ATP-grasp enzyme
VHELEMSILKAFGVDFKKVRKMILIMEVNETPKIFLEMYADQFDEGVIKSFKLVEEFDEQDQDEHVRNGRAG